MTRKRLTMHLAKTKSLAELVAMGFSSETIAAAASRLPAVRKRGGRRADPAGNDVSFWLAIELRRRQDRSITWAATQVQKVLRAHVVNRDPPSIKSIREAHLDVEKRRATDAEFEKFTTQHLADVRSRLEASGPGAIAIPMKLRWEK